MIPDTDLAERSDRRIFWWIAGVITIIVAALLLLPKVQEELAPKLVRAWTAVEAEGSGVAVVGVVDMAEGTPFRLHAVLEGVRRNGTPVYYTEAPALRLGGRAVPAEQLQRWDRADPVRVLWFTVEGVVPYIELAPDQGLDRFRFEAFFHNDWGFEWSVPGRLEPANDARLVREQRQGRLPFGTQRYQARVEIYGEKHKEFPLQRFVAPGPDEVMADPAAFPTATVTLPGPAATASAVFGLTGIAPPDDAPRDLLNELTELTRQRLAFEPVALLRQILAAAGRSLEDLTWRRVDLAATTPWGDGGVATGDLLRVGDRFVVLYRDEGVAGVLDRDDLCFDYAQGAAVRRLGEVFSSQGGDVDWASLAAGAAGAP